MSKLSSKLYGYYATNRHYFRAILVVDAAVFSVYLGIWVQSKAMPSVATLILLLLMGTSLTFVFVKTQLDGAPPVGPTAVAQMAETARRDWRHYRRYILAAAITEAAVGLSLIIFLAAGVSAGASIAGVVTALIAIPVLTPIALYTVHSLSSKAWRTIGKDEIAVGIRAFENYLRKQK